MSHPDPRRPAEANGAYPYELPVHDAVTTGAGTGMPGTDARQHEEWHHADPLLPGAEDADEGGIRDADVVTRKGPAGL